MYPDKQKYQNDLAILKEREKELKCLYKVEEIINEGLSLDDFFMQIVKHIWGGWQYPVITRVKITFEDKIYKEKGWTETEWVQSSEIIIDDNVLGKIEVFYTKYKELVVDSQFLPQEQKLLNTIASNISTYIFNKKIAKALKYLENNKPDKDKDINTPLPLKPISDSHWVWRKHMVDVMAKNLDLKKYGINALYIIGSVKNANAGPASDIDLLIHFSGKESQKSELSAWFEGWSLCLSEMNLAKTGYATNGLIDLHFVTDEDIVNKTSFASMINSVTDGARLIK
jgi:hypothetical protein